MNIEGQIASDMAAFSAPPPAEAAAAAKERARREKDNKVTPDQIKAAKELAEQIKEEKEATTKALLIRQLMDYLKHIQEFYPERVQYLNIPKNFQTKATIEQLRVYIADVKAELGKKSGLETLKVLWTQAGIAFEKLNENERFGLKVQGLGQAAENSVLSRRVTLPDGSTQVVVGPAIPTLAEFAVAHSNWFQSSVDWRMCMMAVELVMGVHRMNSMVDVPAAQATPVSKETDDLMNKL